MAADSSAKLNLIAAAVGAVGAVGAALLPFVLNRPAAVTSARLRTGLRQGRPRTQPPPRPTRHLTLLETDSGIRAARKQEPRTVGRPRARLRASGRASTKACQAIWLICRGYGTSCRRPG